MRVLFLANIFDISQRKEEESRNSRWISRLILIFWFSSIGLNLFAYNYASSAMEEAELGHVRTFLTSYMDVLLIYIVSFIAGFILSSLIFYSILKHGSENKLYIAGGAFFFLSGILDIVAAYYTFHFRKAIEHILTSLPLIPYEDLLTQIYDLNDRFAYQVDMYNTFSIASIGSAFIFFGLSSILIAKKLMDQFEAIFMHQIFVGEPTEPTTQTPQALTPETTNIFKSAVNDIRLNGVLYTLSGILDLFVLLPGGSGFTSLAFMLFLIGMYFEHRGYKKLQSLKIRIPGGFSQVFYGE